MKFVKNVRTQYKVTVRNAQEHQWALDKLEKAGVDMTKAAVTTEEDSIYYDGKTDSTLTVTLNEFEYFDE